MQRKIMGLFIELDRATRWTYSAINLRNVPLFMRTLRTFRSMLSRRMVRHVPLVQVTAGSLD